MKKHFKQLAVSFKIYADFESVLKEVQRNENVNNALISKSIKNTFLAVLLTKLYVLIIDLESQLFFTEEKNAVNKFTEVILKQSYYCKKL